MYKWEAEARKKYSDETVNDLIEQQRTYERQKDSNDCNSCGKNNQGAITNIHGKPFIIHYGKFTGKKCDICGRSTERGLRK